MALPVLYRAALPTDHSTLVQFQIAMARETENLELDLVTVQLGVQAVFDDSHRGQYFVAEKAGEVLGSLLIIPEWSDWRNGQVWWIHSVYVPPRHRGGGIFSGLYRYIQARVQADPQLRGLRLYVDKRNPSAQAIYKKLGMNGDHYHLFEWMKTF